MKTLSKRVGPSEEKLLIHIAENPLQRNKDLCLVLQETKGNVSNRIKRLRDKGFVKTKNGVRSDKYLLTFHGLDAALKLGADLHKVIEEYSKFYDEYSLLYKIDKVLLKSLDIWKDKGKEVLMKIVEVYNILGDYSESVQIGAGLGLLNDWAIENKLSPKNRLRIGRRLQEIPEIKKAMEQMKKKNANLFPLTFQPV